jgi:DNA helicase-2/ATP-dependent DNA helicase PcrA
MKLQQNLRDVESFQRICYKSDFYLDKKTVEFACTSVRRRGITFLEALKDQAKRFDKIARQVQNFEDYVRTTSRMGALEFLQYLDSNGYGAYMQKNHLDHNKFDLLLSLADENPTVPGFLARLTQLRELTADNVQDAKVGIFLTTAHSSKGLEYDTVYLMDVYDGQFPGSDAVEARGRKQNMDLIQEERRLFYVAMTRAKNHLNILSIKGKSSSFVDEILPPAEVQKTAVSQQFYYGIGSHRIEQEKHVPEQAKTKLPVFKKYGNLPVRTMRSVAEILNANYDQDEYLIYDMMKLHRMKCTVCGTIQPEREFIKFETCNKGICHKCFFGE